MDDKELAQVLDFIKEYSVMAKKPLIGTSDILIDIRLRGADAMDMLLSYSKHFNVSLKDFLYEKYIEDEDGAMFIKTLFSIFPKDMHRLTLNDLAQGIRHGELNEEVINKKH